MEKSSAIISDIFTELHIPGIKASYFLRRGYMNSHASDLHISARRPCIQKVGFVEPQPIRTV